MYYPNNPVREDATIPMFSRWFGSWRLSLQRRAFDAPQLEHFYDIVAPGWNSKLNRLGIPKAYARTLGRIPGLGALNANTAAPRVLDCGVGTGTLSRALMRFIPFPVRLDAIDISSRMLERAERNLRSSRHDVWLRQGDARDLPYDEAVFDLVICGHMLEHLANPVPALAEMTRVLKPGGLLVLCVTPNSALGAYIQMKWRTHRVAPDQAESWLTESGFEGVQTLPADQGVFSRYLTVACFGRKPTNEIQER